MWLDGRGAAVGTVHTSVIPAQAGIQAISSAGARRDAATAYLSHSAPPRNVQRRMSCAYCVGSCLRRNDGKGRRRCSGIFSWWAVWGWGFVSGRVGCGCSMLFGGVRLCSAGGGGLGRCAGRGEIPVAGRGYDGSFSRGSGWPFARRRWKCGRGLGSVHASVVPACAGMTEEGMPGWGGGSVAWCAPRRDTRGERGYDGSHFARGCGVVAGVAELGGIVNRR